HESDSAQVHDVAHGTTGDAGVAAPTGATRQRTQQGPGWGVTSQWTLADCRLGLNNNESTSKVVAKMRPTDRRLGNHARVPGRNKGTSRGQGQRTTGTGTAT